MIENTERNAVLDEVITELRDRSVMTDNWEWAKSLNAVCKIVEQMKRPTGGKHEL